jgi:hypothetical protein
MFSFALIPPIGLVPVMMASKKLCPKVLFGIVWELAWEINKPFWGYDVDER